MISPIGYVLASRTIVENKQKIRFMYREIPDNPQSSGWVFTTGSEDQDYADDPQNWGIYDVATIVEIDRDIEPFLSIQPPCAFERLNPNYPFVKSANFKFKPGSNSLLFKFKNFLKQLLFQ